MHQAKQAIGKKRGCPQEGSSRPPRNPSWTGTRRPGTRLTRTRRRRATASAWRRSSRLWPRCASRGETLSEVAHDARNMVTALGLYCDLLEEPGVLATPFMHYGHELRLVAAASRRLVEKIVASTREELRRRPLPASFPSWHRRNPRTVSGTNQGTNQGIKQGMSEGTAEAGSRTKPPPEPVR